MVRHVGIIALLVALASALACSGGKPAPPSSGETATATATGPSVDLSLVYVDSSKGQGGDVYVSAFDGATPRRVATLPPGIRAMDVRGNLLVAGGQRQLALVDLKAGMVRNVQSSNLITDGRFANDTTFVFTTYAGCGPPSDSKATVTKLNTNSLQLTELAAPDNRTLNVAGVDATLDQVAITLRGCDVGINDIAVYSLSDGKQVSKINTRGCGWASVALALKKALVSWQFCSPTAEHPNTDVSLLDLATSPPGVKDLKAPMGGANLHDFLLRPGQAQAALATQMPGTPGPGFKAVPTGLWLLDLNTGAFSNLAAADGLEQYPVEWSTDGRYLLTATVRAMGLCDYQILEATTKAVRPISKDITFCGANGEVLGWTALR